MSAPNWCDKETNQLNRQVSVITRLAAILLLAGIATVGCAGHNGAGAGQAAGSTPAIHSSQVDQTTPTLAPTPTESAMDSPTPSSSVATSQADAPGATPDPLDSQLSGIENLLNGVNNSLSGSDAGSSGGE
jgi:hypothetical protein